MSCNISYITYIFFLKFWFLYMRSSSLLYICELLSCMSHSFNYIYLFVDFYATTPMLFDVRPFLRYSECFAEDLYWLRSRVMFFSSPMSCLVFFFFFFLGLALNLMSIDLYRLVYAILYLLSALFYFICIILLSFSYYGFIFL